MKRLLGALPDARILLAASVCLGLFGGVVIILEATWLAKITDRAFLGGEGLEELLPALLVLLSWIILRVIIHTLGEWASTHMAARVKHDLRNRMARKLVELGPQAVKSERSGELLSTLYEGVEQLEIYLARYVPQLALSTLIPVAVLCAVVRLDWTTTLILAFTLPLLIFFMILIGVTTKSQTERQYRILGLLSGHFHDVVRGLPTLMIFNRSKAQRDIIRRIGEEHRKATMGTLRLAFLSAFVMELFATLCTAIVAVFLGLRLMNGGIEFYQAYCVLLLTPEFYLPVRALGTQFHNGMNGKISAQRILDLLEEEAPGWIEREGALTAEPSEASGGYRIELTDVGFTYPLGRKEASDRLGKAAEEGAAVAPTRPQEEDATGEGRGGSLSTPEPVTGEGTGREQVAASRESAGIPDRMLNGPLGSDSGTEVTLLESDRASTGAAEGEAVIGGSRSEVRSQPVGPVAPDTVRPALDSLHLTIEPGQRVAVIGHTGAGKSTLLELLQGFLRPTVGTIRINGVDMAELSMVWWRSKLAVVAQGTRLFSGTVLDNIRLGHADASREQAMEAARRAQADEFIQRLPQGYDTPVSEAVQLSGGQMQRVSIARALLKDAPVLLLDEPTAQLDLHNEALVQRAWNELVRGRTVIMAAHRLDTVRMADWLVVLQHGRIAEAGKPSDLLKQGGLYARMVHRQQAVEDEAASVYARGSGLVYNPGEEEDGIGPAPDREVGS